MRHLQTRIVLLIAGLALYYTLAPFAGLDGHSLAQWLTTGAPVAAAVLIMLLVPASVRRIVLYGVLAAGGLFLSSRLLILPRLSESPSPAAELFTGLTGPAFLILLATLAYLVAGSLDDFRRSVAYITFESAGGPLPGVDDSLEQIQAEITRSRHYQRPLSVLAIELNGRDSASRTDEIIAAAQAELAGQYARALLAGEVRRAARSIDLVLDGQVDGELLVLCPEADRETAADLAGRVLHALEQAGASAQCAAATFPDEGLTFPALVAEARAQLC